MAAFLLAVLPIHADALRPKKGEEAVPKNLPYEETRLRQGREGEWIVWRDGETDRIRRIKPAHASHSLFDLQASTVESARAVLRRVLAEFGIEKLADRLQASWECEGLASRHFFFGDTRNGVPVEPGRVSVHLDRSGHLLHVTNTIDPELSVVSDVRRLSRVQAIDLALRGETPRPSGVEAILLYMSRGEGLILSWRVRFLLEHQIGDWEVWIDAGTGTELERIDRASYSVNGRGQLWTPNPITALRATSLPDMDDQDQEVFDPAYQIVTLNDLDNPDGQGNYALAGPWVRITDWDDPIHPINAFLRTNPDDFITTRSNLLFEAVMIYYHLDRVQRYVQSLGYFNVVNRSIEVDPHGVDGEDNSYFIPSTGRIAYGDGCVDDAEDAEVIIHEYGHAIQHDQIEGLGGFGTSHEMGSMGEGFSDYNAARYVADEGFTFALGRIADWDGWGSGCWPGRRVENDKTYPDSMINQIHADGEIWSGALWDIRRAVGGETTDRMILESHFAYSRSSTFQTAAYALLEADRSLYGGNHGDTIAAIFRERGILDQEPAAPSIAVVDPPAFFWQPGPYAFRFEVSGDATVLGANLVYGTGTDFPDTAAAVYRFQYRVEVPEPLSGDSIRYFIEVTDDLSRTTTLPADAPASWFSAALLPDTVEPVIIHTALRDMDENSLPVQVIASVLDNHRVDPASVRLEYRYQSVGTDSSDGFTMFGIDGTAYSGYLPEVREVPGTFSYRIFARDFAGEENEAVAPDSGQYSFSVLPDTIGPEVVHAPLQDIAGPQTTPVLTAIITDPAGIDDTSVRVEYTFRADSDSSGGSFPLSRTSPDGGFSGIFPFHGDAFGTVHYRITAMDRSLGGNRSYMPPEGFYEFEMFPSRTSVSGVGPNPFRTGTEMRIRLASTTHVSYTVFDLEGRTIATVWDGDLKRGEHHLTWDGKDKRGQRVSQGIYFYWVQVGALERKGRLICLR